MAEGMLWLGGALLLRIEGMMNAQLYTQILNDEFLGTLRDLGINKKDIYFQQDNDPKHTSRLATDWFNKKRVTNSNGLQTAPI
jgi:hypothetical protein